MIALMNIENNLIITSEEKVVYIGENMFSHIDLAMAFPFAYPSGSIKKDDIIFYFNRNLNDINIKLFEKIGTFIKNPEDRVLFIGAYDNDEIQPITKYGEEICLEESNTLLDIFFRGIYIKVIWDNNKQLLKIYINEQYLECFLTEYDDMLLVFDENGIYYFQDNFADSRKNSVEDILRGEPYYSYIRHGELGNINLKDILLDGLFENFRQLICTNVNQKYIFINGDVFSLSCFTVNLSGNLYYFYSIVGQGQVLNNISNQSSIYQKLNSIKKEKNNNIISSTFKFLGNDSGLYKIKYLLQKACNTNVTILLTGESGTGKTFMAKEIHKNSKQRKNNFVHVNCAAIPNQLIESELFGYEDGAFTGAKKGGKKGYFELANEGTIFLDEISDIPLDLQGKLLEVIQSRTFYRVGGIEKIKINVRFIAATNSNLEELISENKFREDLYYRLNVFPIELPPLRSRKEELFTIVTDLLPRICKGLEIEPLLISSDALQKIKGYNWPGNIRELENILERSAILCDSKMILPNDIILPELSENEEVSTVKENLELCEKKLIISALKKYKGDKKAVSDYLDIGRTSLYEKIKKYDIKYSIDWGGTDDSK